MSLVRNDQNLEQTGTAYRSDSYSQSEIFPGNRLDRLPNVRTMTGYTMGTGLFGNDYPTHIIGNYYVFKDNLTLSRSSHTWKAGLYLGHFRKSEELRTPDAGAFAFADGTAGGTGVALGNMLLGVYDQYTEADRAPYPNMRYNQLELYAQDHWAVTPSLSVDYGIRYQYMPAMYERDDLMSTFDPALYDPSLAPRLDSRGNLVPGTGLLVNGIPVNGIAFPGQDGVPRGLYSADRNNVAPRAGFVWDPLKNGRTAIRGGFGVYFDRPVMNSTRDQAASPPFVRTVVLSAGRVDNPGGGVASAAPPGGFEALDRGLKAPTVYQWSLGVQRMLPWKLTLDLNYVSNEARNLLRVRELNFVTPGANGVAPTPVNGSRPYTGYGRITINETTAKSDYQGLQVQLNRRSDADASFGIAYTWSRSRGDADSEDSTSSASMAQDPRNPGAEWANQDFDRRHVFSVNYIYYLPWYRHSRTLAGHLLGGWQITGITRFNTGRRLNITAGTNTAIFGDQVTLRANGVEGVDPNSEPEGGRTERMWLNLAAFTRPAANQLGDLPRNAVEGPSFFNTDLSLFKNIGLGGPWKVQLRAEVFNVFNQRNFRTIGTNITATNFGQVTAYEAQRIFQLGLKINF